jgi:hypothetical protein
MKTLRGRQYSFQKLTHVTMLNKVLDPPASNINDCLIREQCLFLWLVWAILNKVDVTQLMKTLRGRQYSFKQQTEFTMLNKVLDPLPSNISDSLTRTTMLLPFPWIWWFCIKVMFSPMKTLRGRQYSFQQLTQYTMLNKLLDSLASNINDSLTREQCFSFHLYGTILHEIDVPHPWKHWEVSSIPLTS